MKSSSGAKTLCAKNAQSNTMVCKESMNFDTHGKNVRRLEHSGRPPEQEPAELGRPKSLGATFERTTEKRLFRGADGTDFQYVPIDRAGYRGLGASLFVEGLESCFVVGFESINLVANNQGVL